MLKSLVYGGLVSLFLSGNLGYSDEVLVENYRIKKKEKERIEWKVDIDSWRDATKEEVDLWVNWYGHDQKVIRNLGELGRARIIGKKFLEKGGIVWPCKEKYVKDIGGKNYDRLRVAYMIPKKGQKNSDGKEINPAHVMILYDEKDFFKIPYVRAYAILDGGVKGKPDGKPDYYFMDDLNYAELGILLYKSMNGNINSLFKEGEGKAKIANKWTRMVYRDVNKLIKKKAEMKRKN